MMKILLVALALVLLSTAANITTNTILWPKPANYSSDSAGLNVTVSPCDIKYVVESPGKIYV